MRKFSLIIFTLCALMISRAWAGSLVGDYDGDGKVDKFSYAFDENGLNINYNGSSIGGSKHYVFEKIDECSSMQLYSVKGSEDVAIDGTCSSQGGQVYVYVYGWRKGAKDWCLKQVITGEREDYTAGKAFPSVEVQLASGCSKIGDTDDVSYESNESLQNRVSSMTNFVKRLKGNEAEVNKYINDLSDIDIDLISSGISSSNVENVNNLAFYMINVGKYSEAGQILESIVRKFPDRVVAKLNLADAYWAVDGAKDNARRMYRDYANQMKQKGIKNKIPSRVNERL